MKLIFATTNVGKLAELKALVGDRIQVLSANDVGLAPVDEDADSFAGNAVKKAESATRATGLWALADDSGLCVEALGGRPGVHSARYGRDDGERMGRILQELEATDPALRVATFECALALCGPGVATVVERGTCTGRIALAPRGTQGFGYDPIFECTPDGRTFAELSRDEKAKYSHRGQAFAQMQRHLQRLHL